MLRLLSLAGNEKAIGDGSGVWVGVGWDWVLVSLLYFFRKSKV